MEKKIILFVYKGHFSYLPPFQSLVEALLSTKKYRLKVICSEEEPDMDELYKNDDLEFIHYYTLEPRTGFASRVRNHLKNVNLFKKKVKHDLDTLQYDILWIIHERTAISMRDILVGRKYILTSYELRDYSQPELMKPLTRPMKEAKVNIQCEYNRAWIARMIYGLKETPLVIPNKPFYHPFNRNEPTDKIVSDGKKIILYQGVLTRERNLDGMCKAISSLDGFKLVLLGKETEYAKELKKKYSIVEFPGFIKSPAHLKLTSNAYIGLVTYNPLVLNCVYCAPNKIWEFSGFGIPMICNEIPGLEYTVKTNKCGVCTDTDDPNSIVNAIKTIDDNYEVYSANAKKMYNSVNLIELVNQVLEKYYS